MVVGLHQQCIMQNRYNLDSWATRTDRHQVPYVASKAARTGIRWEFLLTEHKTNTSIDALFITLIQWREEKCKIFVVKNGSTLVQFHKHYHNYGI
jgi:hypothetical protein